MYICTCETYVVTIYIETFIKVFVILLDKTKYQFMAKLTQLQFQHFLCSTKWFYVLNSALLIGNLAALFLTDPHPF